MHVLSTPPAFILSQDQTLQFRPLQPAAPANGATSLLFGIDFLAQSPPPKEKDRAGVWPLTSLFLYLVFKEPAPRFRRRIPTLHQPPGGCQALSLLSVKEPARLFAGSTRPRVGPSRKEELTAPRFLCQPPPAGRYSRPRSSPHPGERNVRPSMSSGAVGEILPGDDLLSHALARAVPLALGGLTAVFGMGTGVSPPLQSPENSKLKRTGWYHRGVPTT